MNVIYLSSALICAVYSAFLAFLKRTRWNYEPRFTWLTVVVGNAILGLHYRHSQKRHPVSGDAAFGRLLLLNISGGAPVILWQLIEEYQRHRERKELRRGTTRTR